jgi:putative glycosyltransferase (TIGR04372 family)
MYNLTRMIDKTVDYFNTRSPVLIYTPWPLSFGNCAEEIYHGLLKARRENKKILFLFPHESLPLWIFGRKLTNRELPNVESDYCDVPYRRFWRGLGGWILNAIIIFSVSPTIIIKICSRLIKRLWPKFNRSWPFNITQHIPRFGISTLWQPEGVACFSWDVVRAYEWKRQYEEYLPVRLTPEKQRRAEKLRIGMGIPLHDWFICLHVREEGFHRGVISCRNASVLNHVEGIKSIIDAGGWVVRLGDLSMVPLPSMERVVDYPHTPFKCDLMDIYLASECRFYIGTNSGPLDVAWLFQKPVLGVNLSSWLGPLPRQKGELTLIKHVFSRSRNRFLSVRELLGEPVSSQCFGGTFDPSEYVMVENTPQEIQDVVLEFLAQLDRSEQFQYSPLQEAFNEGVRAQIQRWFTATPVLRGNNHTDDMVFKYRMGGYALATAGTLGQKYLEQNWIEDSMNKAMGKADLARLALATGAIRI